VKITQNSLKPHGNFWGNPDNTSMAPLPMGYTSMGYTTMGYTSRDTRLDILLHRTYSSPKPIFELTFQGKNVYMNILSMFYFYNFPLN
jgi:hypothetical protein